MLFALKETALETANCHVQEEPLSCTTGRVTCKLYERSSVKQDHLSNDLRRKLAAKVLVQQPIGPDHFTLAAHAHSG